MKEFKDYLKVILEHEGGYVNHPNDPGGETNYGISLRFLKGIKLEDGDIDNDNDIDIDDIQSLTLSDVENIYMLYFWLPLNLGGLTNEMLKLHIFDHGVNAGVATAAKMIQRLIGLKDDGLIGPMTCKAINQSKEPLVDLYKQERIKYYDRIIEKNPKLSVFRNGWINRVNTTKF